MADVGAGISGTLVETNTGNIAIYVRPELNAQLQGLRLPGIHVAGVVLEVHPEHGQFTGCAVVKSHDTSEDIGVPAVFFMPLLPPVIAALYCVAAISAELGVSVAVAVLAL